MLCFPLPHPHQKELQSCSQVTALGGRGILPFWGKHPASSWHPLTEHVGMMVHPAHPSNPTHHALHVCVLARFPGPSSCPSIWIPEGF